MVEIEGKEDCLHLQNHRRNDDATISIFFSFTKERDRCRETLILIFNFFFIKDIYIYLSLIKEKTLYFD